MGRPLLGLQVGNCNCNCKFDKDMKNPSMALLLNEMGCRAAGQTNRWIDRQMIGEMEVENGSNILWYESYKDGSITTDYHLIFIPIVENHSNCGWIFIFNAHFKMECFIFYFKALSLHYLYSKVSFFASLYNSKYFKCWEILKMLAVS